VTTRGPSTMAASIAPSHWRTRPARGRESHMAATRTRYRVHRVDVSMTKDAATLERFLDGLEGEVVSIVPNVTAGFLWVPRVDFLLVVEKIPAS